MITTDRLREIEIVYPVGDLPGWLRKALGVMIPKLARAVATDVVDGGPAITPGQMLSGSMTDVVNVGFLVKTDVELRLTVEGREGDTFTLSLLNDGRDISVRFTVAASPGLQAWHINVPDDAIRALEESSTD